MVALSGCVVAKRSTGLLASELQTSNTRESTKVIHAALERRDVKGTTGIVELQNDDVHFL